MSEIKDKYAIPVIGMISSGKSTFLNSLLGIDVLETKDDVTTKFVCIIRHNSKLKLPKFYHIILEQKENSEDYSFIKDGEELEGKENILKKISNINVNESEKAEPDYENLFYVLETNITNISNEKFLNEYDFYDIPGLNEYIKNEESAPSIITTMTDKENIENKENKNEKFDENLRYIKGIFQYIKTKIKLGIIVVDCLNCYKPQNIKILEEIYKVLNNIEDLNQISKNKITGNPIYDYLFILNKIDTSYDKKKTIDECRNFFINNIEPNIFNIEFSIFAPISSIQLKNEMLMNKNFENYFRYFFNKFYDKYIIIKESEKESTPEQNETKTPHIDFKEFLILELTPGLKNEEKFDKIEHLSEEITDEEFKEVKDIFEKIKLEQKLVITYGLNFEDDDDDDYDISMKVFKALYKSFKDKIINPEFSDNTKEILKYFNDFDYEKLKKNHEKHKIEEEKVITTEEQAFEEFRDAFHVLQNSVEINETNILNVLEKDLKRLDMIVKNKKKIYIPFFGGSSAGKSTILNNIVGYNIFPQAQNECTTRGIIVEYSNVNVPELYQCVSKEELDYYCFEKGILLAKGRQKINNYLSSLNSLYANEEEKCFFILKTPIDFFDSFDLSEELKNQVCFIDLPGGDTKNNTFNNPTSKDRTIYEKLLKMSSSFIFINKGRALKDTKNINILQNTFNKIYNEIITSETNDPNKNRIELLKSCLFVINMFTELKEEEKQMVKLKKEIVSYLFLDSNPDYESNTKGIFIDAKTYQEYLREKNYFMNLGWYLDILYNTFQKQQNDYNENIFNLFGKTNNFIEYCLKELNDKINSLKFENKDGKIIKFNKKKETGEDICNEIITFMEKKNIVFNKQIKKLKEFSSLYKQVQDNINSISLLKKSNNDEFFFKLKEIINNSKKIAEINYKENLMHTIRHFDEFFSIDIKNKKNKNEEEANQLRDEFFKKFDMVVEETRVNINYRFDIIKIKLIKYLEEEKKNSENLLKKNENIPKSLEYISEQLNGKVQEESKMIDNELLESNKKIDKIRREYEEKLKLLDINTTITEKVSNFDLTNLKQNINYRQICFSLFGLGGVFLLASLLGFVPVVGWVASAILSLGGIFGWIFDGSNKDKLIKAIDEIIKKIDENVDSKSRSFLLKIMDYYKKLRDDYVNQTSLDISNLENVKIEKFNESRNKYEKAKELLGLI